VAISDLLPSSLWMLAFEKFEFEKFKKIDVVPWKERFSG